MIEKPFGGVIALRTRRGDSVAQTPMKLVNSPMCGRGSAPEQIEALRATGIEVLVAGPSFEASDVNAGAYSAYNRRGT